MERQFFFKVPFEATVAFNIVEITEYYLWLFGFCNYATFTVVQNVVIVLLLVECAVCRFFQADDLHIPY